MIRSTLRMKVEPDYLRAVNTMG